MADHEIRWTASPRQYAYLSWLVRETGLGRSENEVAKYLLTQKIQEMRLSNYEEPQPENQEPE